MVATTQILKTDNETNGESSSIESFYDSITQVKLFFRSIKLTPWGCRMANRIWGVSKDEWDNAHLFNSDDTLFKVLLSLCGMGMATSQRFVLTNRLLNKKIAPT